jgi:hypothetical protein
VRCALAVGDGAVELRQDFQRLRDVFPLHQRRIELKPTPPSLLKGLDSSDVPASANLNL